MDRGVEDEELEIRIDEIRRMLLAELDDEEPCMRYGAESPSKSKGWRGMLNACLCREWTHT